MDMVLRAIYFYILMMVVYIIAGKRAQGQLNAFDFVMMLVIAAASGAGMMGTVSLTDATLVIITLVAMNLATSMLKSRSLRFDRLVDGTPIILVENGHLLQDRLRKVRIREEEVLAAARETQGLEHLEQIKHAVLERRGTISVVPAQG